MNNNGGGKKRLVSGQSRRLEGGHERPSVGCWREKDGSKEVEREIREEEVEEGSKGEEMWKLSVRNASLLEDNPCTGSVCLKSNQSICINYYPPPPPTHTPFNHPSPSSPRWHTDQWEAEEEGVSCYAFSPSLSLSLFLIHTPIPHPFSFFFFF